MFLPLFTYSVSSSALYFIAPVSHWSLHATSLILSITQTHKHTHTHTHYIYRYTMNPNTRISQVWELVGVVMSLVSVLAVSTQAAFLHDQGWLWAINYLTDLYFIADMFASCLSCSSYHLKWFLIPLSAPFPPESLSSS